MDEPLGGRSVGQERNVPSIDTKEDVLTNGTTSPIGPQDIEYRYLTFDTEVPLTPVLPIGLSQDLPPCPCLRKYDNPFSWPLSRKNWMTYLASSVNITAAYAAGSYEAPAYVLTKKWHVSGVAYNLGITMFTVGFGIAPMVLAPFSEINGRRPVFVVTGILFVICQLGCALTDSYAGMLLARFWAGVGGSTFSTMVGGILADIWESNERNTPMVLFTGATLFGTGLGPLVSGFVAQRLDWRWVFYIQIITSGCMVGLVIAFFEETRGTIILSRKAKVLNKWYDELEAAGALGMSADSSPMSTFSEKPPLEASKHYTRLRFLVKADEERGSLLQMISLSLYRPFHLLFTEPVVFFFSIWLSFTWSVLYLQFGSIPLVFSTNHDFTLEQTGAVFAAVSTGGILSTILSIYQEKWALRNHSAKITGAPEGRLWFTCVESALVPIGLFMFGFTCYREIPWIVPAIAIVFATMGIFSVFLGVFNYTADVYGVYASSALAGIGLCRNLAGGSFPLVTAAMFNNMGFQAASSTLGGIGAVLTLVPWVLLFFGPRIRARSRVATQLAYPSEDTDLARVASHGTGVTPVP